jgi:ABC-type Mn2+/Zn2+ transport system permease subunit
MYLPPYFHFPFCLSHAHANHTFLFVNRPPFNTTSSMYAYPVTFFSAIVCAVASCALEGSTDIFGWLMTPRLLVPPAFFARVCAVTPLQALTACASFISGILGHTAANFTLKSISPLALLPRALCSAPASHADAVPCRCCR